MKARNAEVRWERLPAEGDISYAVVDLADLDTIKPCVDCVLKKTKVVDYLILNAGIMATPYTRTKQNLEMQIGKPGCVQWNEKGRAGSGVGINVVSYIFNTGMLLWGAHSRSYIAALL